MLDNKDLELLRAMMQEVVGESEARMTARIDDVETRMTARINDVETRMTARIEERVEDTRSTIMGYLESAIEPKLRALAEGHQNLYEGKASNARVDRLEEELCTVKAMVMILNDKVAKLNEA